MGWTNPANEDIKAVLNEVKTIAGLGLSDKPQRTSYQIAKAMQEAGYKIIPVNPNVKEVLGGKAYPSLLDMKEHADIINVFRRSECLPQIAKEAIQTDCKVFWAQQGVVHE